MTARFKLGNILLIISFIQEVFASNILLISVDNRNLNPHISEVLDSISIILNVIYVTIPCGREIMQPFLQLLP